MTDQQDRELPGATDQPLAHLAHKQEAVQSFVRFTQGEEIPIAPLEIYLELSNVCDLQCVMCPRFSALNPDRLAVIASESRGFMDVEEITGAVRQLLPAALKVHVFGYGESTIHPRFAELVRFLCGFEVLIELFTNGMHLEEEMVRLLVGCRVHRITISLSGARKEDYESVYLGGDFDRVLAGLARLRDAKRAAGSAYPLVEVNSLSFRHHVARLDRFVELMAEHGVGTIQVSPLQEHAEAVPVLQGHAADPGSLGVSAVTARAERLAARLGVVLNIHGTLRHYPDDGPDAGRELWRRASRKARRVLRRWFRKKPRIAIGAFAGLARTTRERSVPDRRPDAIEPIDPLGTPLDQARVVLQVEPAGDDEPFVCLEPFKTLYIRRNGEVKVCCYMQDDVPSLGHVHRQGIGEIWQGAGYRAVRQAFLGGEYPQAVCGNCLRRGQAPASHRLDSIAAEYLQWAGERIAGIDPKQVVAELAPIGNGTAVVTRLAAARSALLIDEEDGDRARRLLAVLEKVQRLEGPYRQLVEGYVDQAREGSVTGWAYSPLFPELRLPVSLWQGDRRVATAVASLPRADLAGKGDGRHGFVLAVGPEVIGTEVQVCLGDTRCQLGGSPLTVEPTG